MIPWLAFKQRVLHHRDPQRVAHRADVDDLPPDRPHPLPVAVGVDEHVVIRFQEGGKGLPAVLDRQQPGHHGPSMDQADVPPRQTQALFRRQCAQIGQTVLAQLVMVEPVAGILPFSDPIIPVSAQDDPAVAHGPVKGLFGTGPLPDKIAQAPDLIRLAPEQVFFQRLDGGVVAMQVRNQCDPHARRSDERTNQSNSAWCAGLSFDRFSGCHWTPSAGRPSSNSTASITPSSLRAETFSPMARSRIA